MKTLILRILLLLILPAVIIACRCADDGKCEEPQSNVICFYYNWYGTEDMDGSNYHWEHKILEDGAGYIRGRDGDISSNYYPEGGIYSSRDPQVVRRHMEQMSAAGIGIVAVTWWKQRDIGNESLPVIFDEAARAGLKVCFQIEPYPGRKAASVREDVIWLSKLYGGHKAYYRVGGKPLFFCYDSYLTSPEDWATVFSPSGANTIRNTPEDVVAIGLLVGLGDRNDLKEAGFDGFYTYFAADGFTEGSTSTNWPELNRWVVENDMIFIPCAGPGYLDARVRPWNGSNTRDREGGLYYERMFGAAIGSGAEFIGVTSFNEWHEGTQIEPAVPFANGIFTYLDYSPDAPDFYLRKTAELVRKFKERR